MPETSRNTGSGTPRRKTFSPKNNLQRSSNRTSLEINNEFQAPRPTPKTSVDSQKQQQPTNTRIQEPNPTFSEYEYYSIVVFQQVCREPPKQPRQRPSFKAVAQKIAHEKALEKLNDPTKKNDSLIQTMKAIRTLNRMSMKLSLQIEFTTILDREKEKRKRGL